MFLMDRSYSSAELEYIEQELHRRYRLGDVFAVHLPCSHKYRVKKGGRKEQQIMNLTSSVLDDQTCSVCFKIRCTDDKPALAEIEYVNEKDGEKPPSVEFLKAKDEFYRWLYERVN
jgi:hypothetical protein